MGSYPDWLTAEERLDRGLPVPAEMINEVGRGEVYELIRNDALSDLAEELTGRPDWPLAQDLLAMTYLDGKDQAVDNMVSGYLASMGLGQEG